MVRLVDIGPNRVIAALLPHVIHPPREIKSVPSGLAPLGYASALNASASHTTIPARAGMGL